MDSQNISNISDPSTTPLCNTSPISFLSPIEPTNNQIEQMNTNNSKSSDTDHNDMSFQNHKPSEQSASTPPPSKKKYDIMKDPIFLASPVYPPLISPKDSISTQRDDYLRPILSNINCTFESQLTSLYMHPTDYAFELYDKKQDFFTSIASKIMTPYYYWLDNTVKIFSLQLNFLRQSIYDLKIDEMTHLFSHLLKKQLIILHTLHFSKTKKKYIFVYYKYTSPYTMTHLYTIDHSRITCY